MKNSDYLIIDFDSTFVKLETLEEIAKESLKGNSEKLAIQKKIAAITKQGMEGKISFSDSLKNRLTLFTIKNNDVENVAKKIKNNITDSFNDNKAFIKKYASQIFIVSGGFEECIWPVSDEFGIPRKNVLANRFLFDNKRRIIGVDEENLSCQNYGKILQVKNLNLKGKIFVVGDGWTDFEIKKEGAADYFLVFTKNVFRDSIVDLADKKVDNFNQVIEFVKSKS